MSGSVWFSACLMCSEPVTLGGGMTMLKRGFPDFGSALKAPIDSQNAYHRGSTSACSKPLDSSGIAAQEFRSRESGFRIQSVRRRTAGQARAKPESLIVLGFEVDRKRRW